MSVVCPVSKTKCDDKATACHVCGFTELNKTIITEEEGNYWFETVVIPYRQRWEFKKREAELLSQLEESRKAEKAEKELNKRLVEETCRMEAELKKQREEAQKIEAELKEQMEIARQREVELSTQRAKVHAGEFSVSAQINVGGPNERGNTIGNIANNGLIVIQDEWIYYTHQDFDYFVNPSSVLYKSRIDGSNRQMLKSERGENFHFLNVVDDSIYCSYRAGIIKMRIDGSGEKRLVDHGCLFINVIDDWVYYASGTSALVDQGGELCKMRTDGSCKQKLNDDISSYIAVWGDWIYYSNLSDDGKLYRIRTDGRERKKLNNDRSSGINVVGDYIYYYIGSYINGGPLYKIGANGESREELNFDKCRDINVVDNWIYYRNESDANMLYKMQTSKKSKQKLCNSCTNISNISVIGKRVCFTTQPFRTRKLNIIFMDGTDHQLLIK